MTDWFLDPVHMGILALVLLVVGLSLLIISALSWLGAGTAGTRSGTTRSPQSDPVRKIEIGNPDPKHQTPPPSGEDSNETGTILRQVPGAVLILSRGLIRCGTREFARQVGSTPEALTGREFKDFVAPEDLLRYVEGIGMLERGVSAHCNLSIRLRMGHFPRSPVSLTGVRVTVGGEPMVLISLSPILVATIGPETIPENRPDTLSPEPDRPSASPENQSPSSGSASAGVSRTDGEKGNAALLANVSHELQTPLVSVKGYTEMILMGKMGPVTAEQKKGLRISLRNIDRLIMRIDELLNAPRRKPGKEELRTEDFPLWKVVDEAIEMVQEKVAHRRISITTSYESESLQVRGDREKIQQVLTNLLHNAVKFNRKGGAVTLTVRARDERFLEVEVRDTGIGIPRTAISRLFDRYYRVDTSGSSRREGTGLGLSIVKSILESHGCDIRVVSELSVGTAFFFSLPRPSPGGLVSDEAGGRRHVN